MHSLLHGAPGAWNLANFWTDCYHGHQHQFAYHACVHTALPAMPLVHQGCARCVVIIPWKWTSPSPASRQQRCSVSQDNCFSPIIPLMLMLSCHWRCCCCFGAAADAYWTVWRRADQPQVCWCQPGHPGPHQLQRGSSCRHPAVIHAGEPCVADSSTEMHMKLDLLQLRSSHAVTSCKITLFDL